MTARLPAPDHARDAPAEPRAWRILHVNKFPHRVGGVESHVFALSARQQAAGHTTDLFSLENVGHNGFDIASKSLRSRVSSVSTLLWSRAAHASLEQHIRDFDPDVVHFHNIYHHLSPSVIAAARKQARPTVMTMHDYKVVAPCYLLFRDGGQCTECVGRRFPLPSIEHRCVKVSRAASVLCSAEQAAHRQTYLHGLDAVIAPSEAARLHLVRSRAVDAQRLHVIPHGVELPEPRASGPERHRIVSFGRLSPEKGIDCLIDAWNLARLPSPWELVIAGDGADRRCLEERAAGDPRVKFVGHVEGQDLDDLLGSASVVVVPSLFPETFGLSAAEAMARGLPVLVSNVGNLPELVGERRQVIAPGDVAAWADGLRWITGSEATRNALGALARTRVADRFDPQIAADRVQVVYEHARAEHARRSPKTRVQ